jgi:F0F1-type ATP synthase epsilon subunit
MELHIITAEEKQTYAIAWFEAQTTTGSFVIQAGHAPMILLLKANEPFIFLLKNGKKESRLVGQGIIKIERHHTTLIMTKPA